MGYEIPIALANRVSNNPDGEFFNKTVDFEETKGEVILASLAIWYATTLACLKMWVALKP